MEEIPGAGTEPATKIAEEIPHLVWSAGPDGRCDYANRRFLEHVGCTLETAGQRPWFEFLHPVDQPLAAGAWAEACRGGSELRDEVRLRRAADGAWVWHALRAAPIADDRGEVVRLAATLTEIPRRPSPGRAAESAPELDAAVAELPIGLCLLDAGLRILRANERMSELAGLPASPHEGARLADLLPEVAAAIAGLVAEVLTGGGAIRDLEIARAGPERDRTWLVSLTPVRDPGGRIAAASLVVHDLTDRKRFEERLTEASRRQDQFLATLSHELRNPLAAIRSAAEVLELRSSDDPTLDRVLNILDRQSAQMARLLDGLLDVSGIVRGKIRLERSDLDLRDVIREVTRDRERWFRRRGLALSVELPDAGVPVRGDRVRLAQVVDNLLSNAVSVTPPGGQVRVRVRLEDDEQAPQAALEVEDTGAGIAPDILPFIFEPFREGAPKANRRVGLGLGLALVKGIAELHGGSADAASAGPSRGSRFTVRLPLAPSRSRAVAQGGREARRLLIVEDHRDTALVMSDVLEASGYQVQVAFDGRSALDLAREIEPEIVLCDIGLPGGMTGYEVAQALRSEPRLRGVYLVALTGYGGDDERERARAAGFDAHLVKPVRLEAIEEILAHR